MSNKGFSFNNKLKGNITQSILKTLLEDVGYSVVPFGVEEVFREVKELNTNGKLELPTALVKMPDFIVVDEDKTKVFLVEVKYRKKWDGGTRAELKDKLVKQLSVWSPIYIMLFLGECENNKLDYPAQIIRIAKVTMFADELFIINNEGEDNEYCFEWDKVDFKRLAPVQGVFTSLMNSNAEKTIEKITPMIQKLKELKHYDDMDKWADYCISHIYLNTSYEITGLGVHVDDGNRVGDKERWGLEQVNDEIKKGKTFITIFKRRAYKWDKGDKITKSISNILASEALLKKLPWIEET